MTAPDDDDTKIAQMRELLEAACNSANMKHAAEKVGIHPRKVRSLLDNSKKKSEDLYLLTWHGHRTWFHEHWKIALEEIGLDGPEISLRDQGEYDEVVVYQGHISYQTDPDRPYIADPEHPNGFRPNYLRDAKGDLIPVTIRRRDTRALEVQLKGRHRYTDKQEIDLKEKRRGVLVVPTRKSHAELLEAIRIINEKKRRAKDVDPLE